MSFNHQQKACLSETDKGEGSDYSLAHCTQNYVLRRLPPNIKGSFRKVSDRNSAFLALLVEEDLFDFMLDYNWRIFFFTESGCV